MPLYKYLPLEFAKLLTEQGRIKISKLSVYQDEEKYGEDIGDEKEGSLTEWSELDNSNHEKFTSNHVIETVMGNNFKGNFKNCIVAVEHKEADYHIYSTSKVFNLSLMRRFSDDYAEKYNACIKIKEPKKFFELINQALQGEATYQVTSLCKYGNRKKHHDTQSVHPVLHKPLKHEYQSEVRSIWSFYDKDAPKDKFLHIPDLINYCELYFIDKPDIKDNFLGVNRISNMNFKNDSVLLDEHVFDNCTFESCRLVFNGGYKVDLNDSKFDKCDVILDGSALRTTSFLKFLRNECGIPSVDNILDRIKKNK